MKFKNIVLIAGMAMTALFAVGCGGDESEEAIDAVISNTYALFDGDGEAFLEVMPKAFVNSALESEEFSSEADVAEFFEGMIASAYADIGYEGHSYKIKEINEIEGSALKELKEVYGTPDDGIEFDAARSVDTELTVKANGRESTADLTLNVIEIDGEWKLDVYSFANAAADLGSAADK